MRAAQIIIGCSALLFIGYFALKEGLHREDEQEKMYKAVHQRPTSKRYPKWYAILLGVMCWGFAFYFVIKFLLSLVL